MNKSRFLSLTLFAIAVAILATALSAFPCVNIFNGSPLLAWVPASDIETNQYLMWRAPGFSRFMVPLLPVSEVAALSLTNLLILLFGTCLVVRMILIQGGANPQYGWLLGAIPTLLALLVTGADVVTLSALSWIPLCALLLSAILFVNQAGLLRGAFPLLLLTVGVSGICAGSSHHFAFIAALGSLFVARCLTAGAVDRALKIGSIATSAIAIIPAVLAMAIIPAAPFPDYPPLAHIVPDDGLPGTIRPLIGLDYPIQVINRAAEKSIFRVPAFALLLVASLGLITLREANRTSRSSLLMLATLLGALCAIDTRLPEGLAQIGPIASIRRLIPWGTSTSYLPFVTALGVWSLSLALVTSRRRGISIPLTTLLALILANNALVYHKSENLPLTPQKIDASPSLAVLQYLHQGTPGITSDVNSLKSLTELPATSLQGTIASLDKGETKNLTSLTDGDPKTRWSSPQRGDESLAIEFTAPQTLRGIELDTGAFTSDFPRGISVLGVNVEDQEIQLASFPSWQGSIAFTPQGYPYFLGQHELRILFGHSVTIKKLTIRQTGRAPFDWSVAEIKGIR